jgi:hypothetical protein
VSSKEGTFSKELGHKSQEKFFCVFLAELFFCCGRPYCTDPYSPYSTVRIWHKNRGSFGHGFRGRFQILFVVSGPYGTVRTTDCWHRNRGTEEVVQQYGFGTKNEAEFSGTVLVL